MLNPTETLGREAELYLDLVETIRAQHREEGYANTGPAIRWTSEAEERAACDDFAAWLAPPAEPCPGCAEPCGQCAMPEAA